LSFVQIVVSPSFKPVGWARAAYDRARRRAEADSREAERRANMGARGRVMFECGVVVVVLRFSFVDKVDVDVAE
jgi:hypothetical protein